MSVRPRTHGNVFLRFCIVSSNELVVLDSLENTKQYKNAGKRFRVYGALKRCYETGNNVCTIGGPTFAHQQVVISFPHQQVVPRG